MIELLIYFSVIYSVSKLIDLGDCVCTFTLLLKQFALLSGV